MYVKLCMCTTAENKKEQMNENKNSTTSFNFWSNLKNHSQMVK